MALNDKLTVVGPIPDSLQLVTPWTAAIPIKSKNQDAAKQLIAFMLSAESQKVIGATGLAPVK
jgi:molybdate transport system substrate-binding protein